MRLIECKSGFFTIDNIQSVIVGMVDEPEKTEYP